MRLIVKKNRHFTDLKLKMDESVRDVFLFSNEATEDDYQNQANLFKKYLRFFLESDNVWKFNVKC